MNIKKLAILPSFALTAKAQFQQCDDRCGVCIFKESKPYCLVCKTRIKFRGKCLNIAPIDQNCLVTQSTNEESSCVLCKPQYTLVSETWIINSEGNYVKKPNNYCQPVKFPVKDGVFYSAGTDFHTTNNVIICGNSNKPNQDRSNCVSARSNFELFQQVEDNCLYRNFDACVLCKEGFNLDAPGCVKQTWLVAWL
jgi:hypothetical protein